MFVPRNSSFPLRSLHPWREVNGFHAKFAKNAKGVGGVGEELVSGGSHSMTLACSHGSEPSASATAQQSHEALRIQFLKCSELVLSQDIQNLTLELSLALHTLRHVDSHHFSPLHNDVSDRIAIQDSFGVFGMKLETSFLAIRLWQALSVGFKQE